MDFESEGRSTGQSSETVNTHSLSETVNVLMNTAFLWFVVFRRFTNDALNYSYFHVFPVWNTLSADVVSSSSSSEECLLI